MAIGTEVTETASAQEQQADIDLFKEGADATPVSGGEKEEEEAEAAEEEDAEPGEGDPEGGEEVEEETEEEEEVEEEEEEEEEKKVAKKEGEEEEAEEKKEEKPKKRIYDETFEKFPKLKEAFQRDKEYREVFATPEEAREAVTDLARFEKFAGSLETGDPLHMFQALFNKDPRIVQELAKNFIPSLLQIHPRLAAQAGLPTFNAILRQAHTAAQNFDGVAKSNLENSVDHLCKFIHGKSFEEWQEEGKNAPKADPRVAELQRELNAEKEGKFNDYYERASKACYNRLDRLIAHSLSSIPGLSILERKALARFVKEDTTQAMDEDKTHGTRMSALWRKIVSGGLRDDQMSEVITAFLGGAKPLMKPILAKRLAEARKGRRPAKGGEAGAPPRVPSGGGAQVASGQKHVGPIDPNKVDYRHTSDLDLFNDKIVFKRK